jgi:hypothetical protein
MKMKFLTLRNFIPVIITVMIFSSCKKDDATPTNDLIGTWTMKTGTFTAQIDGKSLSQYLIDELEIPAAMVQSYLNAYNESMLQSYEGTILIKSDNTYSTTMGGDTDTGTWMLSADKKKLTINSSTGDTIVFDVIELTSNTLNLQATDTETDDYNDDNIPETMTTTINLTFTK